MFAKENINLSASLMGCLLISLCKRRGVSKVTPQNGHPECTECIGLDASVDAILKSSSVQYVHCHGLVTLLLTWVGFLSSVTRSSKNLTQRSP